MPWSRSRRRRLPGVRLRLEEEDILNGRKIDPTSYPVSYGAFDDADWTLEKVWYQALPSLGHTIDVSKVRNDTHERKHLPVRMYNE